MSNLEACLLRHKEHCHLDIALVNNCVMTCFELEIKQMSMTLDVADSEQTTVDSCSYATCEWPEFNANKDICS